MNLILFSVGCMIISKKISQIIFESVGTYPIEKV
jgi:hypothetical protein